jgi:hypothetical protein
MPEEPNLIPIDSLISTYLQSIPNRVSPFEIVGTCGEYVS